MIASRPATRGERIVLVADLAGTALFAGEGALIAMAAKLDLLGVAVIAFVTALGGGIVRDLLLGDTPPAALRDRRYPLAVVAATILAILAGHRAQQAAADVLLVLDAAGLALFAASGTQKAFGAGSPSFAAIMLGTLTATGGGAVRDVLLASVPAVLRIDFYATAALAGAVVIAAARAAGVAERESAIAGGIACFVLRLLGVLLHWHLPVFG